MTLLSTWTLWTVRPASDFDILSKTGVFITDPQYVDSYHINAYRWLSAQLAKKVAAPIINGTPIVYPVWAWHTAHSKQKPKPDLRYGGFLPKGTMGVRIEFIIDRALVLLSDFDAWHSVLNDWCYTRTKKEFDDHDILQKTLSKADFDKIKEQSWQGIFDISHIPDDYAIQAVFWQLKHEWVTKVDYFKAR